MAVPFENTNTAMITRKIVIIMRDHAYVLMNSIADCTRKIPMPRLPLNLTDKYILLYHLLAENTKIEHYLYF